MNTSRMRFKFFTLLALITSTALICNMSYAETSKNNEELPASFSAAKNIKAERLLAQYIGDMYIALGEPNSSEDPNFWADPNVLGELDSLDEPNLLSLSAKEDIDKYIDKQIILTGSSVGKERADANLQIQRLWRLSIPGLLANLGHQNSKINEAVMKNLILMRNEVVIEQIINKVNSSSDPRVRYSGVFALGMMMEKRQSVIRDREVLGEMASSTIVNKHIRPFLNELEGKTNDETMNKIIQNAREFLRNPVFRHNKPQ